MIESYLAQVEARFIELSGKGLMLSAKDVALVESWERAHIPLHIVLRAIERAMDHAPASVRGLNYVRKAVEEEASTWRRATQGTPIAMQSKPADFKAVLSDLSEQFERATAHAPTPAIETLCRLACDGLKNLDARDPEDGLKQLRQSLIAWSEQHLEPQVEADLAREVNRALQDFALRGPEIRRALRWKKLRVYAGCPDLVLPLGEK